MLVSPSRNPVRNQLYDAQIAYYNLPIKTRAFQAGIKRYIIGGQRYKQAFIKKKISKANRQKLIEYGQKWRHAIVEDH